jgi:uncharacterized protein involved in outer membrane biogenesis
MRSKKQKFLRILGISSVAIVCFLGLVVALAAIYEKEVSSYFLKKLNERLNTRVEINTVELSLLKNFPFATIRLNQVKASHTHISAKGHLLDVERIDLMFSVFSLWSGDYAIRKIEVAGGKIQLLRDESGKTNYDIIKPMPGGQEDSFGLSIDQIIGRKIDLVYHDRKEQVFARMFVDLSELSGHFSADAYNLDITADLETELFKTDQTTWIRQRPIGIDFSLHVNNLAKTYTFKEGTFIIAELELGVEGEYKDLDQAQFTIALKGKNLDITTALSLLPPEFEEKVKAYKSKGKFYGEFLIKQNPSSLRKPEVYAHFGVEQGTVSHQTSGIELNSLNLQGELKGDLLKISKVNMLLNGQKISGSFTLKGFKDPKISLQTDARLNLADLGAFLDLQQFENLKGIAELHLDLKTSGAAFSTIQTKKSHYLATGSLVIADASFRLKDDTLRFQHIQGHCTFNQTDMEVKSVSMKTGQSDFSFSGKFLNFSGWLLGDNEILGIRASISAKQLVLDEFFQRKTQNAAGNEYRMEISPRINLDLNAKIDQLQFRKFRASNIQGVFRVNDQQLSADPLRFNTMGGTVSMSGGVNAVANDRLGFSCTANLKGVNIQRLFFECENFGQQTMQDKNLKGRLDAALAFSATGSKSLDLDASSVESTADITINNGELIRFEPLNVLGRYISMDELQHVKFSQLRNQIRISKQTIYFPLMNIESSALSISGSGSHTFDNEIDYHIRVRLSDILSKKARRFNKKNEEFGEVADDGSGGLNLFLSMKGPIENPKISYDTKGARDKRKDDIRQERENLRQLIKEEFRKNRQDSSVKSEKPVLRRRPAIELEFDE